MEAAQKKAQALIDENAVMIFSKSYCPYCRDAKSVFSTRDVKYKAVELNQMDDGDDIQDALQKMTGQRTVPNIFIGGTHIGGSSDLNNVVSSGKDGKSIDVLLKEAGAL
ncbi:hypothetical protein CHGG_07435 [Chaetomium globosum CBS 148.51]|jgi:glutaredoxin 3|uniref:Glutaredoxin domain-containing protein n=1 Tax=Chaetomium globosum (strain ATCC 6205 / CBS 148.51 / DSM 1962 / NBRC 6347 / NRRL 1970) TaxID=306901 RepID=Q2GX69_CHAGB|nr:uncharacterized protein CHGG_07435 [Chaetomium globosum CBS 148.51]EAQ86182.1 hypothetical protein CHGG_07435 [Chaetomium globosum CBS 148.51]